MPRSAVANRVAIPQVQNLFLQSEDYVNASWTKGDLTAITGQGLQPYSTSLFTANSVTPSVNNVFHTISQVIGSGLTATYVFALTIYAKWQQNEEWLWIGPNGVAVAQWFNIRTGTLGSAAGTFLGKQITSEGNGWYRCEAWLPCVSPASVQAFGLANGDGVLAFVGSNTPCQLWWGASCAAANWTGPYVQTQAATVNTGPIRNLRSHA